MRIGLFITFFISLIITLSISGQEQVTHYQGDQCCYDIRDIVTFQDQTFAIAEDDFKGVEIYKLEGKNTTLLYSNQQEDKTHLLDRGLSNEHYYFIYKDHLEIFSFATEAKKQYPYPDSLEGHALEDYGSFYCSPYGFLIFPEENEKTYLYYSFENESYDTLQGEIPDRRYKHFIDSVFLFKDQDDSLEYLYAYNYLNGSSELIHSTDKNLAVYYFDDVIVYGDSIGVYMTKGDPSTTYFLEDRKEGYSEFDICTNDSSIAIMYEFGADTSQNRYTFTLYSKKGEKKDDIEIQHDLIYSPFQCHISDSGHIVLSYWQTLYTLDEGQNEIVKIGYFNSFDFILNGNYIYYPYYDDFYQYNLSSLEMEAEIQNGPDDVFTMERGSGNEIYLRGRNDREELTALFTVDIDEKEITETLKLDDFHEGLEYGNLIKKGDDLYFYDYISPHLLVLENGHFKEITQFRRASNIVAHKGQYYVLSLEGDLYQREGSKNWEIISRGIPVKHGALNGLLSKNNKLYLNNNQQLIWINLEDSTHIKLTPSPQLEGSHRYKIEKDSSYIIFVFRNDAEVWLFDLAKHQWMQILDSAEYKTIGDNFDLNIEILNERVLWFTPDSNRLHVYSMSIPDGNREHLMSFDNFKGHYRSHASFLPACGNEVFIYFVNEEFTGNKLWLTDGTRGGTREAMAISPSFGLQAFYQFENKTYFSAVDSSYTQVYSYDCGDNKLSAEDWNIPLITQGQYRFNDRIYTLGQGYAPAQNLTLASREGNHIEELLVSPNDPGFRYTIGGILSSDSIYHQLINDTLWVISASFDEKGEELWFVSPDGNTERMTDLNPGIYDAGIRNIVAHEDHLYFLGYQYGVGQQVWRLSYDKMTNVVQAEKDKTKLSLSPNPASHQLDISNLGRPAQQIRIFNSAGQLMGEHLKKAGVSRMNVSLNSYPDGVYFIQAVGVKVKESAIFVKNDGS